METAIAIALCAALSVTGFVAGWLTHKFRRSRTLYDAFNDGYVAGALAKSKYECVYEDMEPRIVDLDPAEPYSTHDETEAEVKN